MWRIVFSHSVTRPVGRNQTGPATKSRVRCADQPDNSPGLACHARMLATKTLTVALVSLSLLSEARGQQFGAAYESPQAVPAVRVGQGIAAGGQAGPAADSAAGAGAPQATNKLIWRQYDIARFVQAATGQPNPQQLIVDWILRVTGREVWHGSRPAVLAADASRLYVYHTESVQEQVAAIVRRFVYPPASSATFYVTVFDEVDPSWRRGLMHLLKPAYSGPHGQQIWLLPPEDIALVRSRIAQRPVIGSDRQRTVKATNGVPVELKWLWPVTYTVAAELAPGWQAAYRPLLRTMHQGLTLKLLPLWTPDCRSLELYVELSTLRLLKLHRTRGPAPLLSGTQTTATDVPEVAATEWQQTILCPVDRSVLISLGMQPGILTRRANLANWLPGRDRGELLVLIDIQPPAAQPPLPATPPPPQARSNLPAGALR